jgi:hypothetical protein
MLLKTRVFAFGGAALGCSLLFSASCGSKSGIPDGFVFIDGGQDGDADADVVTPDCITDEDCDTGDLCSQSRCQEGKCTVPLVTECDDGDECTEDTCKSDTGLCDFRQLALDQDGDGFKGPKPGFKAGEPGSCGDDCDDTSAKAFPGGQEICDGVDNNCNGIVDEGSTYIPSGAGDIRVSALDQTQAGHGGLAWNGEFYAAAYAGQKDAWRTFVKGLNPDGSTKFGDSPITNVPNDTFTGPIVWTGAIFGTAWEDRRDNDYEIYFNRINAQGEKLGPDVRVTSANGFSLHPSMVWNGAEFLLVWDDRRNGPGDYRIYAQRITVDGALIGDNQEIIGVPSFGETPRLAEGQKTLAVTFNMVDTLEKRVAIRLFGPTFDAPQAVTTLSNDTAVDPSVIWNEDRYIVAYSKRPDGVPGDAIWGATVDENSNVLITEKQLTTGAPFARTQSMIALGDRWLLVWADTKDGNYEIYTQMFSNALDPIAPRQRVTNDASDSIAPFAAFGPNGDVGVLFDDRRTGSWQVYFSRLICAAPPSDGGS